ncbi:MAG TPA: 3-methyl-2-oxobutanoate dehydrogenase subunit VorB [Anaerolineae bacterium]|nr:3-methyl-2-oxobutanoate dehydrogenase subunit VorB [Anaerolineae bacterium]HQH39548.1 3-methyl-2-oxobutanoate dehydrogenase subunit VorB [Anaerolineae bacterium]
MTQELLKGNVAFAEAAIRYGVQAYFGYPITPQSEALEHLSGRMIDEGRVFLQAESEVAAINMVYGAACAGVRVMASTSGPGFSLMAEGFSYIAGSEVPVVIVNMMRGGPGLGNIQPSQGDYFFMTKSAGHGDFHPIVLAPANVQELIDMMGLAFDLAEKYRTLVFVAGDGALGQMMESAELPPMQPLRTERPHWAVTGNAGREARVITSLYLDPDQLEKLNVQLQRKLALIKANEVRWQEYQTDDAELLLIAYGTVGRICLSVMREARQQGLKVGLLRPQTLWPLAEARIAALAGKVRGILVAEMSAGQMVEDVERAARGQVPVRFHGRMGGIMPMVDEILADVWKLAEEVGVRGKE